MNSLDVKRTILSYLLRHPDSKDSIDGIVWWLLRERIDFELEQVRGAVNELITDDLLHKRDLGTITNVVELNKRRRKDIQAFLTHQSTLSGDEGHV